MKNTLLKNLTLAAVATILCVSCIKDNSSFSTLRNEGYLELSSMSMDFEKALEITPTRVSEINTAGFTVNIFDSENALAGSWIYSQLPDRITLPVGQYTIEIFSGEAADAAWDSPCYGARQTFSIEKDQTTPLGTITCSLTNIMVSVSYNDYMLSLMDDDCKVTVTIGKGEMVFGKDESRIAYFKAELEENTMTVEFSGTIDGEYYAETNVFDGVKAGQHQMLKYSLKENPQPDTPQGEANFKFSIDLTCNVLDVNKNIDITEDLIPDPDQEQKPGEDKGAPTIEWVGGILDQTYKLTTTDTTQVKIPITIDAPNGIAEFTVDIISTASAFSKESLQDLGLDTHLDFVNPGDMKSGLESLGFKTGEDIVGQTNLTFNITTFVPMFVVANNEEVNFKLSISDAMGNPVEKTLMLEIEL